MKMGEGLTSVAQIKQDIRNKIYTEFEGRIKEENFIEVGDIIWYLMADLKMSPMKFNPIIKEFVKENGFELIKNDDGPDFISTKKE